MIQLAPTIGDDHEFLAIVQRIVNGSIAALNIRDVFMVQIDNWFDHKWLGWRSGWLGWSRSSKKHSEIVDLRIPMFTPNRVRSEQHLVWDEKSKTWTSVQMPAPLHVDQPGRPNRAKRLADFSEIAAFVWYSGNSIANQKGSLMFYFTGVDRYAWYASIRKGLSWSIADEFKISRSELIAFEVRGRRIERAMASPESSHV